MPSLALIKYSIIALIIAAAMYIIYDTIYDLGYNKAEQKYTLIIEDYNKKQDAKVENIQNLVVSLTTATSAYNNTLTSDMRKIKSGLEGKTLVLYKDGKCVLSKEFQDSRIEAINKANKR